MKTGIYWQDPEYPAKGMDFIFDPSLVLYLPLHRLDGASFMSKDAYGHLCTVTGALWKPNGRDFDGDDYIDCGHDASLNLADAYTVEMWIKITDYPPDGWATLLRKGAGNPKDNNYLINLTSTGIAGFVVGNGTNNVSRAFGTLSKNIFYHLTAVFTTTDLRVYLDGEQVGDPVATGWSAVTNANDCLLASIWSHYFEGLIGEARIYNRALTPLEVQNNYLSTKWRYQ